MLTYLFILLSVFFYLNATLPHGFYEMLYTTRSALRPALRSVQFITVIFQLVVLLVQMPQCRSKV